MTKDLIPLQYVGPAFDTSGYGSACRGYITALLDSGEVDMTIKLASFERQHTTHGIFQKRIESLLSRNVQAKIQIVHLTPENYTTAKNPSMYSIGYTTWETETLPAGWVHLCNTMDEIWVPSQWNIEIFKESGVTKPIYCVPHIVPVMTLDDAKSVSMDIPEGTYLFYSIFQWLERKNPIGLLRAYLSEFTPQDKVCLAIKSYRLDASGSEQQIIKNDIVAIKRSLNISDFPPVLFFGNLMPLEYIKGFHKRGDCFVLPHRGEGFGIPHAEAMSCGKPVISTAYSGNTEFMNQSNSYLIRYQRTPVTGMLFSNYHGHMTWADPDIMHLRELMRYCYTHQDEARKMGQRAQAYVAENLNATRIASIMTTRLRAIHKEVLGVR